MLLDPDGQAKNTTRSYELVLSGPEGASLAGTFDGTETFRVTLWPGDSRVPVWESTTAVVWAPGIDFTTAVSPTVILTIPRSVVESLDEGVYRYQIVLNPDIDDSEIARGDHRIVSVAGTETAEPVYSTYQDLEDEYPGIGELQFLGSDQSGFAEARAWARRKVDETLAARAIDELESYDRFGYWDPSRRSVMESLSELLAQNRLEVTPKLREVCTLLALGRIFALQASQESSPWPAFGRFYQERARWALLGYTGRLDADGDGTYETIVG